MGSTYYSLNTHIVFSTKERRPLIAAEWIPRLRAYLGGCARTLGAVPIEIGGVEDHAHLFLGLKPALRLSDLMREIKTGSCAWVHGEIGERLFGWQDGYAAFSVSPSQIERVRRYIRNQAEHHRRRTFDEELRELLAEHGMKPFERG